ncbi:ubiquitin-protein transferase activating protein CDC20 NDAI_0I01520 [Naumovozyma dairenensis CBS 421]|uniref:CDC20/Fizzy WD40 domain-containing protein n=1 Tax=Naumovozyma dairenensis (strain ATCC 10597 / BCRC 20456 / CBS 421 / NBRC 0211 / NRRL Y-12639) TaxID=1071378 RepID=G0WG10_NAUDC|nr:hypothetical protein NDAI_0I01520 [Naumovozyma dairenensis CBS 421]CCD26721.1 hypothetical protein NDAI_0I01520 [Naumovozyma dairenensis CBS 421]
MSEEPIKSPIGNNNPQRSALSIASPAKLNIISSEWSKTQSKITKKPLRRTNSLNITGIGSQLSMHPALKTYIRPKLPTATPPILSKRNSSFFKDDSKLSGMANASLFEGDEKTETTTVPTATITNLLSSPGREHNEISYMTQRLLSRQESLDESYATNTDRFLPILQNTCQNKVDPSTLQEELPPPNASPITHLRAQTKLVFKQSVAEACGLSMNQRILQYVPPPPVASFKRGQSYNLKRRTHYTYQNNEKDSNTISTINKVQQSPAEMMKLRKVVTNPERILDALGFKDDFYLNLLSWSANNTMGIALDNAVYLWDSNTGIVKMLVEYNDDITVSSIIWSDDDCHISIGKSDGNTEIWDVETMRLIRTMRSGLGVRIGSLSWLGALIASGARSGEIQINDVRIKEHIVHNWSEHKGEVCGLAYKSDGLQLASGGNDNTMMIWDTRKAMPQWIKRNHTAAVKALSWCPYKPNLLASGGGQTDKYIHFWNSTNGARIGSINSGSQVSSLHWGQSYDSHGMMNHEIVATGGGPENAISIFNYNTKFKVAEIIHAHESRICTSQLSPDGTTLATVGGDENLKFFKIFEPRRQERRSAKGGVVEDVLSLFGETDDILENRKDTLSTTVIRNNTNSTTRRPRTSDYLIR